MVPPASAWVRLLFVFVLLVFGAHAQAGGENGSRTILVFGDSLSAAYCIPTKNGWPSLLQDRLRQMGFQYRVVNESVKGETTQGGLARIEQAVFENHPSIVILELGANDGLRKVPIDKIRNNLQQMLDIIRQGGAVPLLVGMRLPPRSKYPKEYAEPFARTFAELAQRNGVGYVPFLLEKVVARPELFLPDRLHPNSEAQVLVLDTVWPALASLISSDEPINRRAGP